MSDAVNQPTRGPSGGVTEAEVLDLVEFGAQALAPGRHEVVLKAIREDPKFGRLINAMRADRAVVMALAEAEEAPPTDLIDRVDARLQVEALRELAQQEAMTETDAAPAAPVVIRHISSSRSWLESRRTWQLATAASLAIVGAVVAIGVRELVRFHQGEASRQKQIARSNTPTPGPETPAPGPLDTGGTALATTSTGGSDGNPAAGSGDGSIIGAPAPAVVAKAPITLERARALAAERRLAISVRSRAPDATPQVLRRVDALSRMAMGPGRDSGWRSMSVAQPPAQYAMLATPTMTVPTPAPNDRAPTMPIFAADGSSPAAAPALPPLQPPPSLSAPRPVVRAIYSVELDDKDRTLSTLVDQLRQARNGPGLVQAPDDGSEETVVFVELPRPIEPALSFAPDDVLWWNSGASAWSRPVIVPVIVESLE